MSPDTGFVQHILAANMTLVWPSDHKGTFAHIFRRGPSSSPQQKQSYTSTRLLKIPFLPDPLEGTCLPAFSAQGGSFTHFAICTQPTKAQRGYNTFAQSGGFNNLVTAFPTGRSSGNRPASFGGAPPGSNPDEARLSPAFRVRHWSPEFSRCWLDLPGRGGGEPSQVSRGITAARKTSSSFFLWCVTARPASATRDEKIHARHKEAAACGRPRWLTSERCYRKGLTSAPFAL